MRSIKLLVLLALVANGLYATVIFPKPLYRAYLNLVQGKPHIGEEFTLRLSVKALTDAPRTVIKWYFGNGHINLLSANLADTVSLNAGDSASYDYILRVDKIGFYDIAAELSSLDTVHKNLWHEVAHYYISVYTDTIFYGATPSADVPYNYEIPDSIIAEIEDSLNNWGGAPPKVLPTLRIYGTIKYRNIDTNTNDVVPGVLMVLWTQYLGSQFPTPIASWYTDANGYYDKTFTLLPWFYWVTIHSTTLDGHVGGFIWPTGYIFADTAFWLLSDKSVNFKPVITNHNEIVKILMTIRETKAWALSNFGITRNYVNVIYPRPGDIPTSYCCNVYWAPFTWAGPLWFSDKIYLDANDIWGTNKKTTAHEWGHSFYYGILFDHVVPSGATDFDEHWLTMVSNPGFAWNEGFAEFFEYASVMDDFPYNSELSKKIEDFYRGIVQYQFPYYKGGDPLNNPNPDGRKVEGAVMQFLYDLWDSKTTPDNYPNWSPYNADPYNFDDENINAPVKMRQTWQAMAADVVNSYGWTFYNYYGGVGVYYKSTWALGIEDFKNYWAGLNFPDISELYKVVIHPFNYVPQYDLPVPYNLQATIVDQSIKLTWSENTVNEGGFWIRRKKDNESWQNYYALIKHPNQTQWYDNNVSEHIYKYKISAITGDTSESSAEVTIQGPPNAPSGLTIIGQPTPNQVKIQWADNSQIEAKFWIARATDGVWNEFYNDTFANITNYIDTVSFLHKYAYKVRAVDNAGHYSAWSNVVEYTCGALAQSNYSRMSAFNNGAKIAKYGNNLYVAYRAGNSIICLISPDNGLSFTGVPIANAQYLTNPAICVSTNGTPYIVWGQYAQIIT
ncbi:MAG: hypothetical protein ABIL40_08790, partial [candidate division WOR-3 bacterium]